MWAWMPARRSPGMKSTRRTASAAAPPRSPKPNFESTWPVITYSWVWASTPGVTRTSTLTGWARVASTRRSRRSSSSKLSTTMRCTPSFIASRSSTSDLLLPCTTSRSGGTPAVTARCRAGGAGGWRCPRRSSHRLWRVGAEKLQPDRQAHARRLDQPQAGLGELGAHPFAQHVAVVVEAVEAAGQLADPRRHLVGRALVAGHEHHIGELRQRAQHVELALVGEQREVGVDEGDALDAPLGGDARDAR